MAISPSANTLTARLNVGAAAARPSLTRTERPSSSRSLGRGAEVGWGAEIAARETSSHSPDAREPAGEHRSPPGVQIGLARERGIQRFELSGRLQEQRRSLAAPGSRRTRSGHATAQPEPAPAHPAAPPPRSPPAAEPRRTRRPADAPARRRARARLRRAGIARQRDRSLQERRRRGHATPRLRPTGRPLELRSDLLVGSRRRRGQMPRPTIGIESPDRSPPPTPGAPPCDPPPRLTYTPRSAPADAGRSPARRSRAAPRSPRDRRRLARFRAARPRATAAAGPRPAPPPPPAADAARPQTAPPAGE